MDFGGGGNGDMVGEDAAWSLYGVDVTPIRRGIDTAVDDIRAELGLAPVSAAMARRRRAVEHMRRAVEYVALRARGYHDDPLCQQVQAALAARVHGACRRCGGNFCVVPVVVVRETNPLVMDAGRNAGTVHCGCCGKRVQAAAPHPVARLEGWQPWHQGYNI
ncbi:hypothetical protein E2562_016440 [Oryza meyeriana var. granulata]|uniref:Uncharacterized protein n=1 Tax=Oryza meyeriana var. granulata TaxID=110450 RepID=A0A6G1EX77_9ORYZ|nr:hypothetical protein E2562_016440 [Oryza meyeriana var. granulata]